MKLSVFQTISLWNNLIKKLSSILEQLSCEILRFWKNQLEKLSAHICLNYSTAFFFPIKVRSLDYM
jgi:hypothetical protein